MSAEPIFHDCPGSGCPSNLSDGLTGQCTYCNSRRSLLPDGTMPHHQTLDLLSMLSQGRLDNMTRSEALAMLELERQWPGPT